MPGDKEIKKEFREKASKDPDKYYATSVLKENGFQRGKCESCGKYFWSVVPDQKMCGDPACSGGFRFIGKTPAKEELDYIQVWQKFAKFFEERGYTPIERYPVVARWRDDTDFVQASIYDFQPWVVSGMVKPPANPLVVPQFSLRFNDIDNVGITGAHYTGFVMIGQHAFTRPEDYDQIKYFNDIHAWLNKGLGLPNEEITYHEDAWAGGGNFGPCMEYFSRGLELGNQVYMMYEVTPSGYKELNLKVLDMGMGHERNAWFTKGTTTSYETTFPLACKNLKLKTGLKVDEDVMKRFLPHSSYLNVDEVEDIDKAWQDVAVKMDMNVKELRKLVQPLAALYSIGEHSRTLLVALSDGALPSNVGGGYNLRVILRRALSFIDQYGWDIYLPEVCEWHAKYLKPIFPELSENLENVKKILDVEHAKYKNTRQKSHDIVKRIIEKKEKIDNKKLMELYDSNGVSPELIREAAGKEGIKVDVPDNFYAQVAEMHEIKESGVETEREEKLPLEGVPDTIAGYFDDYKKSEFKAKVVKIIDKHVVLDSTLFYPTSGGQLHDSGTINGQKVVDIFKQGSVIVHLLSAKPKFKQGDEVKGKIDSKVRLQLAQHHTATHIVNEAARKILGNHINQAGAKKTLEKAHLDITHYASLTQEEMDAIEKEAMKIVSEGHDVITGFMPRDDAEKKYGMAIYQGGAVPGKDIRVVEVKDVDVEACGGTHLHNTNEVGVIKLIKSTKIQDGIVRLEFVAGESGRKFIEKLKEIQKKVGKDLSELDIRDIAEVFSVETDKVPQTIKRFNTECEQKIKELAELEKQVGETAKQYELLKVKDKESAEELFKLWKELDKMLANLRKKVAEKCICDMKEKCVMEINLDINTMRNAISNLKKVLLYNPQGQFVFKGSDSDFKKLQKLGAKGGGAEIKQGKLDVKKAKKFKF
jgi:alanyl-tRNA synthetase